MIDGSCHCGAVHLRFDGTRCRRCGVPWAYDYEGEGIHVARPTRAYIRGDREIEFHSR